MTTIERAQDHGMMAAEMIQMAVDTTRCPGDLVASMTDLAIFHARAAWRLAASGTPAAVACPGCSGAGILTDDPQVLKCTRCSGLFTADWDMPLTFDQACRIVRLNQNMLPNAGADGSFYFDLAVETEWKGKREVARVHGWADSKTKRVVQFG